MKCSAQCDREAVGPTGLCRAHSTRRARGYADWQAPIRAQGCNDGRKCKQADCSNPAHAKGYCRRHYQRAHYGLTMLRPAPRYIKGGLRIQAFTVSADVFKALQQEAEERGLTLTEVARQVIEGVVRGRVRGRRNQYQSPERPNAWTQGERAEA
jgi:hypothetical protein